MPSRKTILAKINYDIAKLYLIHCFDNRPLWFSTWSAICVPNILLARIPLAGASARGKHYQKFFEEHGANKNVPVIIATHFPCGWFAGQPESEVKSHGKQVVDHLIHHAKMKAINIHFSLNDDKLSVHIYDPGKLADKNDHVKESVKAAKEFNGRKVKNDELAHVPTDRVIIAKEVYGPPIGGGILVAHDQFVVSDTLAIAQKLNGGEPIVVECVEQVYSPNYANHE